MVLNKRLFKASLQHFIVFILFFLAIGFKNVAAQNVADSLKKPLLAAIDKKAEVRYIVRAANAEFPEVLKGNEEEATKYIENFSVKKRDYLIRIYTEGQKLLPMAESILEKYDLPSELKVLLALESAYNGNAVSRAGAVGYWQMMGATAREYGLKTGSYYKKKSKYKGKKIVRQADERKNFTKSTHAAAQYLSDRTKELNDDLLMVVASYNCGGGNVRNAIRRSKKDDPTFWDIKKYLPAETQAYVMNFIAVNVIFNNYDLFTREELRFTPQKIKMPINFDQNLSSDMENSDAPALIRRSEGSL
ncbi:hypothetical protein BH11BAC3_BH11BAC3_24590 [soil metagenome]